MSSVTESEGLFYYWPRDKYGRFLCTKDTPMPVETPAKSRWRHDDAEETDADSDSYLEFKCPHCGIVFRTEMPD